MVSASGGGLGYRIPGFQDSPFLRSIQKWMTSLAGLNRDGSPAVGGQMKISGITAGNHLVFSEELLPLKVLLGRAEWLHCAKVSSRSPAKLAGGVNRQTFQKPLP